MVLEGGQFLMSGTPVVAGGGDGAQEGGERGPCGKSPPRDVSPDSRLESSNEEDEAVRTELSGPLGPNRFFFFCTILKPRVE